MGWQEVVAALTSIVFGALSAIIPLANAEAYVVAAQMTGLDDAVRVAVCVAIGQTVGKALLFIGVRRGRDFPFVRRHLRRPDAELGPTRLRFRRLVTALLGLLGQRRWGVPVVLLAALVGIPPLYAVALLAGATRMRLGWFLAAVLAGRTGRFVLLALGVGRGLDWWFA